MISQSIFQYNQVWPLSCCVRWLAGPPGCAQKIVKNSWLFLNSVLQIISGVRTEYVPNSPQLNLWAQNQAPSPHHRISTLAWSAASHMLPLLIPSLNLLGPRLVLVRHGAVNQDRPGYTHKNKRSKCEQGYPLVRRRVTIEPSYNRSLDTGPGVQINLCTGFLLTSYTLRELVFQIHCKFYSIR